MDIPVELTRILISELGDQQVIFLKEIGGERQFPIMFGIAEALAIDRRLKGIEMPRPMTHDLLAGVIAAMGGSLERIVVNDLAEHTFYARLYIRRDGEVIEVDSRPSDAIALGAALGTPLYVAEHVFDAVMNPEPASREDRLALLRTRQSFLQERIAELEELMAGTADMPEETLQQHRQMLTEMRTEHDAIAEILRKYEE